jgi:mitochondrial import receptor subunit TOM7
MNMQEETKEKIRKGIEWFKKIVHVGFIPFVIYMGYMKSYPRPNLMLFLSPLATPPA